MATRARQRDCWGSRAMRCGIAWRKSELPMSRKKLSDRFAPFCSSSFMRPLLILRILLIALLSSTLFSVVFLQTLADRPAYHAGRKLINGHADDLGEKHALYA